MKLSKYTLFYAGVLLLWLCVAGGGLELWGAMKWHAIEHYNRFVLARHDTNLNWPTDEDNLTAVDGVPISNGTAPPPSDPAVWQTVAELNLGTRIGSWSEEDRLLYASLNGMLVALFGQTGANLGVYLTPETATALGLPSPEELANRPLAEMPLAENAKTAAFAVVSSVLSSGTPGSSTFVVSKSWGDNTIEVLGYPLKPPPDGAAAMVLTMGSITGMTLTELMSRQAMKEKYPFWLVPFFEYRPDIDGGPRFSTNRLGFRSKNIAIPKPPDIFRIACVGGSTTEEGFANHLTCPALLEKRLNEYFKNKPPIEVVNCGIPGLDSYGERRRTLDYVHLEPDLIVEYDGVNDICHAMFPRWQSEAPLWEKVLARSRFFSLYAGSIFGPNAETMARDIHQSSIGNLKAMAHACRTKKVPLALCSLAYPYWPDLQPDERDYYEHELRIGWQGRYYPFRLYATVVDTYNQQVRELCQAEGLFYIPVAEGFRGVPNHFVDICHLRPKGVAQKAEILFEQLKLIIPKLRKIEP